MALARERGLSLPTNNMLERLTVNLGVKVRQQRGGPPSVRKEFYQHLTVTAAAIRSTGDGCWIARILPGIRRCVCSANFRMEIGSLSFSVWPPNLRNSWPVQAKSHSISATCFGRHLTNCV